MIFAHDTEVALNAAAALVNSGHDDEQLPDVDALDAFVDRMGLDGRARPRRSANWPRCTPCVRGSSSSGTPTRTTPSRIVNAMLRETARTAPAAQARRVGLPPARHARRRRAARADDGRSRDGVHRRHPDEGARPAARLRGRRLRGRASSTCRRTARAGSASRAAATARTSPPTARAGPAAPRDDARMALSDFPRYPLLFGPSPIHQLERLTAHLGGATIWAKREDCNSGLAFGGNKMRKLEYLVPDALAQGATHLVSIGGVQSNHTRQVAAVAAKLGLKARLVQESWVDWPDAVNDRVGNILLSRIMGAEVELVEAGFGIGFKDSWEQALEDVRSAGRHAVPDPGRRVRPPARRPRLRRLGRRGGAAGAGTRRLLRHDHRLQRHRLDARRHDRRLRRAGSATPGARHRRVGQAGRDARPGREDRPQHRRTDRAGPRPARRRDHRARRAGPATSTASRCSRPSTPSGCPAASRR